MTEGEEGEKEEGKMCMSHKEERERSREIMTTGETKENGQ